VQADHQAHRFDLKIIPGLPRRQASPAARELHTTGVSAPLQDYGWISQPKFSVVYGVTPWQPVSMPTGASTLPDPHRLPGAGLPHPRPGRVTSRPSTRARRSGSSSSPLPIRKSRVAALAAGRHRRSGQHAEHRHHRRPRPDAPQGRGLPGDRPGDGHAPAVAVPLQCRRPPLFSAPSRPAVCPSPGRRSFRRRASSPIVGADYQANGEVAARPAGARPGQATYIDDLNAKGKYGGFAVLFDTSRALRPDAQGRQRGPAVEAT
jgi:iron complex outermembrane receptor protein